MTESESWSATILANSHCAHCVHVTDRLADLALAARVPLAAIDLWAHPEAAAFIEAEHSPVLVLEGPHGEERVFLDAIEESFVHAFPA